MPSSPGFTDGLRMGAVLFFMILITGCSLSHKLPQEGPEEWVRKSGFQWRDLAKSDVNLIVETHQREVMQQLRILMSRLYRRNPSELGKSAVSLTYALRALFDDPRHNLHFPDLQGKRNADCLNLAFDPDFRGDRVKALMVGLGSMIMASYNDQREFFLLDGLDAQKLHNSARNVEIAMQKLALARSASGQPLILAKDDGFQRLFGKIIATQDILAKVVSQKNKRMIKNALQSIASSVFMPI